MLNLSRELSCDTGLRQSFLRKKDSMYTYWTLVSSSNVRKAAEKSL